MKTFILKKGHQEVNGCAALCWPALKPRLTARLTGKRHILKTHSKWSSHDNMLTVWRDFVNNGAFKQQQ